MIDLCERRLSCRRSLKNAAFDRLVFVVPNRVTGAEVLCDPAGSLFNFAAGHNVDQVARQ